MSAPPNDGKPYYVVLGRKPLDNAYAAVVEHSFAMGTSSERCQIYWSSDEARAPLLEGLAAAISGRKPEPMMIRVDGKRDAEEQRDGFNRIATDGLAFAVWDCRDPNLPIDIDWEAWHRDNEPAETMSGVRNKFRARNAPFVMKEDAA